MKFIILLSALLVCGLSARVPRYQSIVKFQDAIKALEPQSRVTGGQPADTNQFPHQASVLSPQGNGFTTCGGSLIALHWVLTAAHCTIPHSQYNVRVGTLALYTGGQTQTSFTAINHDAYHSLTLNNDISLVSIPSPFVGSDAVALIRLPSISQNFETFTDHQAIVSGWGTTGSGTQVSQSLNWVHMRVIPNAQCAGVFGTSVVVEHVVCALGWDQPTQGHCSGDSGGPLIINEGGVDTQIGVVSFVSLNGCDIGLPSGYMRTSHFLSWISGHTGIPTRP